MTAPIDRAYVEILPQFKNFNGMLKKDVTTAVSGVGKELEGISTRVGDTTKKIAHHTRGLFSEMAAGAKSLFITMAPMAAGFGIFEVLKGSIAAAGDQNRIMRLVTQGIKSTGGAAHVTAKQINELTSRLSEQTGISKTVITDNESILLTFTNVRNEIGKGNDIFNQASKAVLDLSVRMKSDGKAAAVQLGKALSDPIKGITALTRVGVVFTQQQKDQIKWMVEHHNRLGAQKIILAELTKEFGGSAVAASSMGAKMKAAWHEIEIQIGQFLMPAMKAFSTFMVEKLLPPIREFIEKHGPQFKKMFVDGFISPFREFLSKHADGIKAFFKDVFDRMSKVDVGKLAKTVGQIVAMAVAFNTVKSIANHPILLLLGLLAAKYPKETADFLSAVTNDLSGVVKFVGNNKDAVRTLVELLAAYKGLSLIKGLKLPNLFSGAATAAKVQAGAGAEMNTAAKTQAGAAAEMLAASRAMAGAATVGAGASVGAGVAAGSGWKIAAVASAAKFSGYFVAALNALSFGESIVHIIKKGFSGFDIVNIITGGLLGNVVNVSSIIVKALGMDKKSVDKMVNDLKSNFFGSLGTFFSTQLPNAILTFLSKGSQSHGGWASLGKALIEGIKGGIGDALIGINDWIKTQVDKILKGFKKWLGIASPSTVFMGYGRDIIAGLLGGIAGAIGTVLAFVGGIPGRIKAKLGNLVHFGELIGRDIIGGMWSGLQAVWGTVMNWFGKIPGWVKSALGIKSPPAWAVSAGSWIMRGLIKGLSGGVFDLQHFIAHFTKIAQAKLMSSFGGGAFGHRLVSGELMKWIALAESLTGVGPSWTNGLITLIMRESGGNPNAINRTDINAQRGDPSRGLMQTIGSTFNHYRLPGLSSNIYDPLSNIVAGIRYILARYGSIFRVQQANPNLPPKGYATGAWSIPTDQLAFLHKREMVIPAQAADAIRSGRGGGMEELLAAIERLITAVERVAPGVGREVNGTATTLRRIARAY